MTAPPPPIIVSSSSPTRPAVLFTRRSIVMTRTRFRRLGLILALLPTAVFLAAALQALASAPPKKAEPLPFSHKIETFRTKDDAMGFSLRLEQPFLADEFEKSNYLRLEALDKNAYLIYPKET